MQLENDLGIFKAGICFLDKSFFWSENLVNQRNGLPRSLWSLAMTNSS